MLRRPTSLLIAALAAYLAHQLAYAVAGLDYSGAGGPDHTYLPGLAAVAVPAGLLAVMLRALGALRHRIETNDLTLTRLALAQIVIFSVMEISEHSGLVALASNPAVWLGVALQPVVAWLILRVVRVGSEIVGALLDIEGSLFGLHPRPSGLTRLRRPYRPSTPPIWALPSRGPPAAI